MITTEHKLRERLNNHRGVNYRYMDDGQAGVINISFYQGGFVLTWEQCKDGDQFNEGNYTRDEVHHLSDTEAVFEFLRDAGLEASHFSW